MPAIEKALAALTSRDSRCAISYRTLRPQRAAPIEISFGSPNYQRCSRRPWAAVGDAGRDVFESVAALLGAEIR